MSIAACMTAPFLSAEENVLTASHGAAGYRAGSELDIAVSVEYTGSVSALGIRSRLPEGWSFVSVIADVRPAIKPKAGSAGTLEFGWITPPASPFTCTYTVMVPDGESGQKAIESEVVYRRTGGQEIEPVSPDPLLLMD